MSLRNMYFHLLFGGKISKSHWNIFRTVNHECLYWLSVIMIKSLHIELRGQEVGGRGHWMGKLGGFRVTMWKICPGQ